MMRVEAGTGRYVGMLVWGSENISYSLRIFLFFFFFKQKTAYEIYQCDWS